VLAWFDQLWLDGPLWEKMAGMVLQQDSFWGEDLTVVPGLQRELSWYLEQIHVEGMQGSLRQVVAETE
jgi:tagaturonate reductase